MVQKGVHPIVSMVAMAVGTTTRVAPTCNPGSDKIEPCQNTLPIGRGDPAGRPYALFFVGDLYYLLVQFLLQFCQFGLNPGDHLLHFDVHPLVAAAELQFHLAFVQ